MGIVITKRGAISPLGIGIDNFLKNIQIKSNPSVINIFDVSNYDKNRAFFLNDFDPKSILGEKGLRNLNRNTLLILSCLQIDFKDVIDYFNDKNKELGLVVGSAFGSLQSISDYEFEIFEKTPRKINPVGFANTVLNSPTSRANIWYSLMSQSTTISQGDISSAKAIEFSIMQLLTNKVDAILCGGAEEINMQTFLGYYLNRLLANDEIFPYNKDEKSSGTIIGEGASFVLLEKEENAKFPIIAKIDGYSSTFSIDISKGIEDNITNVIEKSNLKLEDIDIIFSSASGNRYFDNLEKKALLNVFGDKLSSIPVVAVKKFIGESIGSSSLFQLVVSSSLKYINTFPSVYFYSKIEKEFIENKNFEIKSFNFKKILLNFSSECGNHSAIILNITE